jgi:hypothetical protein
MITLFTDGRHLHPILEGQQKGKTPEWTTLYRSLKGWGLTSDCRGLLTMPASCSTAKLCRATANPWSLGVDHAMQQLISLLLCFEEQPNR